MNQKITVFFKTYWVAVWLILVSLALVSFSAYTAYMRTQIAKRVVSTLGGAGNRFSSNRMEELVTEQSPFVFRVIPVQGEVPAEGISKPMTVCNYPQGIESSFYPETIYFDLDIELTDNGGLPPVFADAETALSQYYITDESGTRHDFVSVNGRYRIKFENIVLKGNKPSSVSYMLHFPDVNTNIYMKSFATPKIQDGLNKSKPADLQWLGSMISVGSVERSQDTNWTGALVEPRENGKNVADYDAFNYVVSGAGAGTITLKWKAGMLDMNQYYGNNNEITALPTGPDTSGYMTLEFAVTASQTRNRYSFQLYKAKNSDWSSISSFSQIANAENVENPLITFNFKSASQNQQQNQGG